MYDFFISFKCTDNGKPTIDREIAEALYRQLEAEGYHVFFSEQILEKDGITKYIGEINQALNDARTFLLVCSQKQYVLSGWVAQEWSAFLNLMMTNENKKLFSYLIDMKESDLPALLGPFQSFQHKNGMDRAIRYLKTASPLSASAHESRSLQTPQEILDGEFGIFGHLKSMDCTSVNAYLDEYPEMMHFVQANYYFRQRNFDQCWDALQELLRLHSVKGGYLASIMYRRGYGTSRDIRKSKELLGQAYQWWSKEILSAPQNGNILLLVFEENNLRISPVACMAVCIRDILKFFNLECTIRILNRDTSLEEANSYKTWSQILLLANTLEAFFEESYRCPQIPELLSGMDRHVCNLGINNIRQINMPRPFRKYKVFELLRNGIGKYCQYILRQNATLILNDEKDT